MSAEGILADPCVFYRGTRTQIPSRPSAPSSSSASVYGEIGVSSGEHATGCVGNSNSSRCINTDSGRDRDRNRNRGRDGQSGRQREGYCSEGDEDCNGKKIGIGTEMGGTGPRQGSSEAGAEAAGEAKAPDRAALFAEYCSLSRMFLTAGGWSNLGQRDSTFDGDAGKDSPSSSSCLCESVCVGDGSCSLGHSDSNSSSDAVNGCSGAAASAPVTVTGCGISFTNSPAATATAADTAGCEKQIETARQHLFWMLGKRGHGRTVRFTHRGPYKMHTDLLNRVKDAAGLEELEEIAGMCLGGVQGSTVFSDEVHY
jgi:hypothetical protein